MTRTCLVLTICGLWATFYAHASTGVPCPVQRAAANGSSVWVICDQQRLLISGDGGQTWRTQRLPTDQTLRTVMMRDSRRGFIAGDEGLLLASEDAAETWRPVSVPTKQNLTSIHFVGERGWLAGWAGVILHTSDGGRTWRSQQSGLLQGLESVFFRDALHGWAVGWAGAIIRTTDGGETWQKAETVGSLWSLESVYFADDKRGWAVGFGGQILTSRDGGATWRDQKTPANGNLKSVVTDQAGHFWIAAENQLLKSEDGGETWEVGPVQESLFLHQMLRVQDSLWAVGQLGVLRRAPGDIRFQSLATFPRDIGGA